MSTDDLTKRCGKCQETKPREDFAASAKNRDGFQSWCRACMSAWRKANKEKMKDYQRRYLAKPEVNTKVRAREREWRQLPDVRKRRLVQMRENKRRQREEHPNAQRLLDVKSGPCTDCGVTFPPAVMELDHVRGVRGFSLNMAEVVRPYVTETLLEEELAKCQVRCPTCHRLRHYYARQVADTTYEEAA